MDADTHSPGRQEVDWLVALLSSMKVKIKSSPGIDGESITERV